MFNCSTDGDFKAHETWLKALIVMLQLLEAISGCLTNICVIIVFFKQNRWNGVTAVLMVNLAVADLAICCIMMPLSIARMMLFPDISAAFHITHESLLSGLRFISIVTLVAISHDRMELATRPLRAPTSNAKKIIGGIWILSLPSFLMPIFTLDSHFFRSDRIFNRKVELFRVWDIIVFTILCLVMFYNYRSVQSVAKHRAANLPFIIFQQTTRVAVPGVINLSSQLNQQKKKVINLSRVIMSSVLLLWTPYLGLSVASFFNGSSQSIEIASSSLLVIAYLNHVLHPVLYAVPSSNWREAACKTFPFLAATSRRPSVTSMVLPRQHRVAPTVANKIPRIQETEPSHSVI